MNVNNKITLKKKSESRKGVKFSPETIRKMSDAKKGKKLHPDVLAQLVERNKNRLRCLIMKVTRLPSLKALKKLEL